MLTSAQAWLGLALVQSPAPESGTGGGSGGLDLAALFAPILATGVGGALFLMVLFKIKIMPTYVYDDAKAAWDKERERIDKAHAEEVAGLKAAHAAEVQRYEAEKAELKGGLKDAQSVYTQQVIPTLTRVLDSERELVDLRREEAAERRRRVQSAE